MIYIYIYIYIIWRSSAPCLEQLLRALVLCSLTRTTLMSLEKDETRVCGMYIYKLTQRLNYLTST